jgi:hypothetical protein
MVEGLAPGSEALTEITGKSTCGSGDTGRTKKAPMPARARPMVNRTVATGRRTKGSERFMGWFLPRPCLDRFLLRRGVLF